MDILFETNYTRNKEWITEVNCYYYFKRKMAVAFWILFCFFSICCIVDMFIFNVYRFLGVFIFAILYVILYLRSYFRSVNLTLKRDLEQSGEEIKVRSVIMDSHIENYSSTGSVTKLHYHNIKSADCTKNYILLFTDTKLIYSFRKDSFTKGDYMEFIRFLRYKGIKI